MKTTSVKPSMPSMASGEHSKKSSLRKPSSLRSVWCSSTLSVFALKERSRFTRARGNVWERPQFFSKVKRAVTTRKKPRPKER
jgi:hypothetical protein